MYFDYLLDRPIAFQRSFVSLGAGVTGALLLSQAIYWSRRTDNSDGWFYKTQAEWEDETGLSRYEQEGARAKLKAMKILEEDKRGIPCKTYYRVNPEALHDALISLQTSMRKNPKQEAVKTPNSVGEKQQSITENTTEITTENKTHCTEANAKTDSTKSESPPDKPKKPEYSAEFEELWKIYPSRAGSNDKKRASRAYTARLKDGYTHQQLMDAVSRYFGWCRATGKINTEYVKQAATFLGSTDSIENQWATQQSIGEHHDRRQKRLGLAADDTSWADDLFGGPDPSHQTDQHHFPVIEGDFSRVE